ncbi:MAG: sulfatase [Actinomycetota bacterium]
MNSLSGSRRWPAILLATALLLSIPVPDEPAGAQVSQPDIVLILSDDQRFDTLSAMPTVQNELVEKGMTFENGFVVNPVCCPSRASILTGLYSHSTGVYKNHRPHGGWLALQDSSTIATSLDDAGYRTGLVGRYLNGYPLVPPYVPPGWDRWVAKQGQDYFGYNLSIDGQVEHHGFDSDDYVTDVLASHAVDFVNSTPPDEPLFLHFSPNAPHKPAIPAPRHDGAFNDLEWLRPPSFDERNVGDKPEFIQQLPRISGKERRRIGKFRRNQFESLLALDEGVGDILTALEDAGRLDNTLVVYSSDNGLEWGEHRWNRKELAYNESIRVPFVARYDSLVSGAETDDHLVLNIDLAPTFSELAGVSPPIAAEGESFVDLLQGVDVADWRDSFLIENMSKAHPTFCAVRWVDRLYVLYDTGEEELYDLVADPYEMKNRADSRGMRSELKASRQRVRELCRPRPPGFRF